MCCAIAASGKSLIPTFIIKNKSISVENSLVGPQFDCGDYAIASSANRWQDGVGLYLLCVVICVRGRSDSGSRTSYCAIEKDFKKLTNGYY